MNNCSSCDGDEAVEEKEVVVEGEEKTEGGEVEVKEEGVEVEEEKEAE